MLDNSPEQGSTEASPRLSLVLAPGARGNRGGIWMGGAQSLHGTELTAELIAGAWLVDLAGDLPGQLHEAANRSFYCVFADLEEVPASLPRLQQMAIDIVGALRGGASPGAVHIACAQGLNRSGLLTGLVLRELGFTADEAIKAIRLARPGGLANHAFVRIIEEHLPAASVAPAAR